MLPSDRLAGFHLQPVGTLSARSGLLAFSLLCSGGYGTVYICMHPSEMLLPVSPPSTLWRCRCPSGRHPRRAIPPESRNDWLKLAGHVGPVAREYLTELAMDRRGHTEPLPPLDWHGVARDAPSTLEPVYRPHASIVDCLLGNSVPLRAIWQRPPRRGV